MPTPRLLATPPAALDATQQSAVEALLATVWPPEARHVSAYRTACASRPGSKPDRCRHTLWDGPHLLAHAETFARTIGLPDGPLRVLALASVCSAPSRRGAGYGAAIVRAAFARIDAGEFPLCLFQTPVPDFYARLGCIPVAGRFVNRDHPTEPETNPWWEPHIMSYPASRPLRAEVIDLAGPGY